MIVEVFFDSKRTKTATFVVMDELTNQCAVIDSVLDYDPASGTTYTESADRVIKFITINRLKLEWVLETHIHADHLTASQYIRSKLGGKSGIGENIKEVIKLWRPIFEDENIKEDGSQFDKLFMDGEKFMIGDIEANVIYTPGHTPACVSYQIGQYLFTGDTIFSPHVGTARTDFPGGSSKNLFNSVQKIYQLPAETKICVGHEYPGENEEPVIITTIGEEKRNNISINQDTTEQEYIDRMNKKQVNLPVPQLILPSLHVNLLAGALPRFIKIPLNIIQGHTVTEAISKGGCAG